MTTEGDGTKSFWSHWAEVLGCHDKRTLLSFAHFLRTRMMYSTWGFPEFCRRGITSLSSSLQNTSTGKIWENAMSTFLISVFLAYGDYSQVTLTHTYRHKRRTWTPCLPRWVEKHRRRPPSCLPSSWSPGLTFPVHQRLWPHNRIGPSETTGRNVQWLTLCI